VGKVSSDNELVEFDVEFCGLGKKHTVQLTQQEADEVELLFDDMQDRLSAVESDDEAMVIFKEAVIELDKYGLLGGLSVKEAQRLITFPYQNLRDNKFLQSVVNTEKLDDNENSFCLILGETTETRFFSLPAVLLTIGHNLRELMFIIFYELFLFPIIRLIPLKFLSSITFGSDRMAGMEHYYSNSNGTIWTNGINGIKEWNGSFIGGFLPVGLKFAMTNDEFFIGVKGFCGIQIYSSGLPHFFGFARKVRIDYV